MKRRQGKKRENEGSKQLKLMRTDEDKRGHMNIEEERRKKKQEEERRKKKQEDGKVGKQGTMHFLSCSWLWKQLNDYVVQREPCAPSIDPIFIAQSSPAQPWDGWMVQAATTNCFSRCPCTMACLCCFPLPLALHHDDFCHHKIHTNLILLSLTRRLIIKPLLLHPINHRP